MSGGWPISMELSNAVDVGTDASNSRGTIVNPSSTANTKGSYAQLIASTAYDAVAMMVLFKATTPNAVNGCGISADIAVGAAGSEIILAPDLMTFTEQNGVCLNRGTELYFLPLPVPAGTRIACRAQTSESSWADTFTAEIVLFDAGWPNMDGAAGIETAGFVSASTRGTTVTPGNGSKGSWAPLSASTAHDWMGLFVYADNSTFTGFAFNTLLDIGIGAAASEQVVIPDAFLRGMGTSQGKYKGQIQFYPCLIPAGTRIAARATNDGTANNINVTVYGVYQ
jgi:hypothetical protein